MHSVHQDNHNFWKNQTLKIPWHCFLPDYQAMFSPNISKNVLKMCTRWNFHFEISRKIYFKVFCRCNEIITQNVWKLITSYLIQEWCYQTLQNRFKCYDFDQGKRQGTYDSVFEPLALKVSFSYQLHLCSFLSRTFNFYCSK